MNTGKAFEVDDQGTRIGVIYLDHFVEEYHLPYKYRAAVEKTVKEEDIEAAIRRAIPEIADAQAGHSEFTGLILALKLNLNMSFRVRAHGRGFTILMTNMMLKQGYHKKWPSDYEFRINPTYTISFERSIDHEIRLAVLEYLGQHVDEFEDGEFYMINTDLVGFGVERHGAQFVVDFAGWKTDMYYIPVLA